MQLEVKINLILHATENENKVLEELEKNFQIEQSEFQIEQVTGHFNNSILLISSKLKKRKPLKLPQNDLQNYLQNDLKSTSK